MPTTEQKEPACKSCERLRTALKIIAKMPDWTDQGSGWAAKVAQHALEQNED